jgi:hypothetical protein
VTTTPLAELLAGVASLNRDDQPFTYAVEGDRIVGRWDIVRATSLYPTEITHIDRDYRLDVTFDADKHTYDYTDHDSTTTASLDGGGLHGEKQNFSGKENKKEFSFEFGGVNKTKDGVGVGPVVYSFDTAKIKDPLFDYLKQHGWSKKKGFLGRLFS